MKKSAWISFVGIGLLCFGLFWLSAIYKRCETIYPTSKANSSAGKISPEDTALETSAAEAIRKVRSPDAKEYHFILFWILACLEIGCAMSYFVAGAALFRRFPWGRKAGLGAVGLDVFFKVFVLFYMFFCAAPLAKATHNPNVLTAYFFAGKGLLPSFSVWVSGLMIFQKIAVLDLLVYGIFIGFLIYFLNRSDVKANFSKN